MRHNTSTPLVIAGNMGGNITSSARTLLDRSLFCLQADVTAATTLSGTLKIQGRVGERMWTEVPDGTFTLSNVAVDTPYIFNVANAGYDQVRLVWTRTAGTATLNADIRLKEAH